MENELLSICHGKSDVQGVKKIAICRLHDFSVALGELNFAGTVPYAPKSYVFLC